MSGRDPYAGGYYDPGGGGYDGGDDSGSSSSSDDEPDGPGGGVNLGPGFGGGGSDDDPDPSPGGSSPPPSDIGGPSPDPSPSNGSTTEPDGPGGGVDLGGVSGGADPSDAPGAGGGSDPQPEPETVSGSTTIDGVDLGGVAGGAEPSDFPGAGGGIDTNTDRLDDPNLGPGPTSPGGRGAVDVGGGSTYPIAEEILDAGRNETIVDRATTGGVLSERGESAGLLPPEVGGVDTSETRAREFARTVSRAGDRLDIGAITSAQAAAVAPFTGGAGVTPSARDLDPLDDSGDETTPENFVEGGASVPFDLPAGVLQGETAAEVAQSTPGIAQDFSGGEIAETTTAVARDRAAETAAAASANPAEFAGAVTAGALAGGAGAASTGGIGSGLRAAARAEVDPRIGPLGTTVETRLGRGVRDFLGDDRGQLQMGRSRGRESGGSDAETAEVDADEDLGPDLDPFERSDRRLYDPTREFDDDVGGMADPDIDARSSSNPSSDDIGGGVSGQGNPQMAPGVEAESFSERGFGDVDGTSVDPNPTDTLDRFDRLSPGVDAGVGGLFGSPGATPTTGADVGGALGGPDTFDATGTTADVGADTRGGVDLDTGFNVDTGSPTDTGTDAPTDTRTDTGGDLDQPDPFDVGTDIDPRDTPDTDTPDPTDTDLYDPDPYDPDRYDPDPFDPGRDRDPRIEGDEEPDDDEFTLFGTRSDDRLVDSGILGGEAAIEETFNVDLGGDDPFSF
ncbi:hypothetical protein [Halobellus litoreus]|uniref:Uncharacterized protein n=2 Tax=Halobellus litoreus TaxID=755310 RepID=A0ABD6DZ75_9EURY